MKTNRRNLVFRVSIVINIAVLLYAAMHLSGNTDPAAVEWVSLTGDGTERGADTRYIAADMRNFSLETSAQKNPDGITYQNTTSTLPTTNKTASSTLSIMTIENKALDQQSTIKLERETADPDDDNVLTDATLTNLRSLLGCLDRQLLSMTQQHGEFWVMQNYVSGERNTIGCHESITYTTHAGFEFLDNVPQLVERWMAPVSLAIHAPGSDIIPAVNSIRYLRDCLENDLIREYVSFHIFFSNKHIPSQIPNPKTFLSTPYNCSVAPPYSSMNLSNTYMKQNKLLYPVNVARNVARENALTHFVLPSDIELYPSPNLVAKFLNMIARNKTLLRTKNPKVFPISIFEVEAKVNVPWSKTELQSMLANKTAIPFHKFVCPNCHNIPQGPQWITAPETKHMEVFHIGKRQGKFLHWEPIFIGTHEDPYYDNRLSWEGKQDKMTQGYVLCLKNYDFMILNNAFLVHKPGIKHYKRDKARDTIAAKQSKFIKYVIMPELKKLYGERKGCVL